MITGSIVAIVTPMHQDGSIDDDAFKRLIDWHIEMGTDAIVAVGTTGESATLTMEENKAVIATAVSHVDGRIPVIGGTGANSTAEALELTAAAREVGADACLSVVPYYNRPTQEGMYQHFRKIAEAVDLPMIVYNVPARTSSDLGNETVLRLAQIANIVGLKDASNDVARGKDIIDRKPADFALYSGEDGTACELMLAGSQGVISVTANVAPALMAKMCAAAIGGDGQTAGELDRLLGPLHKAVFIESSPSPSKWALEKMGLIGPGIRLPLLPLSEPFHEPVMAVLRQLELV